MNVSDIVVVDFDGTIVESAYPKIGALKKGAIAGLQRLRDKGMKIHIFTSRPNFNYEHVKEFLDEQKVPYDLLLMGKPFGTIYIDDKGIRLQDWDSQIDGIENQIDKEKRMSKTVTFVQKVQDLLEEK